MADSANRPWRIARRSAAVDAATATGGNALGILGYTGCVVLGR